MARAAGSGRALLSAAALAIWTHPERRQVVRWYAHYATLNETIVETLVRRRRLDRHRVVASRAPRSTTLFATDGASS